MAERIALQPNHALRLSKSLLKHGQSTSYDTLMEMSAAAQAISYVTDDHVDVPGLGTRRSKIRV